MYPQVHTNRQPLFNNYDSKYETRLVYEITKSVLYLNKVNAVVFHYRYWPGSSTQMLAPTAACMHMPRQQLLVWRSQWYREQPTLKHTAPYSVAYSTFLPYVCYTSINQKYG